MTSPSPLPIDSLLPDVLASLRTNANLILISPPGSGKTTRLPPALVKQVLSDGEKCIVLEPRRIAARAAARRVSEEHGTELGREVGYQVRFENKSCAATGLLFVTEGVLTARLQSDPFLEGVGAVVLDEFHERSLEADLALAFLREIQTEVRPALRIVVLSATLDPDSLAAYLDAPVIRASGRPHTVDVHYLERIDSDPLAQRAAAGIRRTWQQRPGQRGSLLAFLPGAADIRRAADELREWGASRDVAILPLHGDLPARHQDAALRPGGGDRVILSTNVAESSVTVADVSAVVDSGLAKVLRHDPGRGVDRLELEPISRASAAQRAGRAGRTGPGVALRLWTRHEDTTRREYTDPEIRRVDLTRAILQILGWGHCDPNRFDWFEAPPPDRIATALELLLELGAVDPSHRVTPDGHVLRTLPLHPRLGRLLLESCARGCSQDGSRMAALLAERDVLLSTRTFGRGGELPTGPCDLLYRLELLETAHRARFDPGVLHRHGIDPAAARSAWRAADQLQRLTRTLPSPPEPRDRDESREQNLLRTLLRAYPDRVARLGDNGRYRMVGGRSAMLSKQSAVRNAPCLVALRHSPGRRGQYSTDRIHWASSIEPEWLLSTDAVREVEEVVLLPESGRVVRRETTLYRDLPLSVRERPADPSEAASLIARHVATDPERILKLGPDVLEFIARCRFLARHLPQLEWPTWQTGDWEAALGAAARGLTSVGQLRNSNLLQALQKTLTWQQREALDQHAPERVQVPSGSRIRVRYDEAGEATRPVLAVKIQEVFGWQSGPRVAQGKVPLLLHLLGPHGRPLQVTDDLESFWKNVYPEIRKEMRGRYPKHRWPEDPWTAPPTRHSVKRKGG